MALDNHIGYLYIQFELYWSIAHGREYFKEVSIETETIVETIENGQGCDLKKSKPVGFRVSIQGCDRNPDRNPGRNLIVAIVPGLRIEITTLIATLVETLVVTTVPECFKVAKLQSKPCSQP